VGDDATPSCRGRRSRIQLVRHKHEEGENRTADRKGKERKGQRRDKEQDLDVRQYSMRV